VQVHAPISLTHFGIKSSPHRPFCRCILQVVFIIVAFVTLRSLSAFVAIVDSVIAQMDAVKKPEKCLLNVPEKNINPRDQADSITPNGNSNIGKDNGKNKK
jgi:hypothetical protein